MTNSVFEIAKWRFFLLRRQRLFLGAMLLGFFAIFICYAVASSSFLHPDKIYWDFVLGFSFVATMFLSVYTSSNLFGDERQRRTLHLILASGISRRDWLVGNFIGIYLVHAALVGIWTVAAAILSFAISVEGPGIDGAIIMQAQLALAFELFIVTSMALCFAFYLRPALALILCLVLVLFLHSQISLLSVLGDAQTGAYNNAMLQPLLQWVVPFFPALEWYDLRLLVGYENRIELKTILTLALMALGWTLFWIELGFLKFRKKDL
jgi:ABC-type transport system involved in multi-copper enzyme maturation permease subunit